MRSELSRTQLPQRLVDLIFVSFASLAVFALVLKWRSDGASGVHRRSPVGWQPHALAVMGGSTAGKRTIVFAGARPTVVFLFRDNCIGCRINRAAWADVATKVGSRVMVRAFTDSGNGAAEMSRLQNVDVGIVQSTRMMHDAFPTDAIPATIVIAPDGRIALSLVGVLQTKDVDAVVATARSLAGGRP